MNCNEVRQHWNLYYDSEGDTELHFQISAHLSLCPECERWIAQQSNMEDAVTEHLQSYEHSPKLWDQILTRNRILLPQRSSSWLWYSGVAAALLLVAFFGYWYWWLPAEDLHQLSAQLHQKLMTEPERVQFRSQSSQEVEKYLQHRVRFHVHCPPRKNAGFEVEGAGICQFAGQQTAYLHGSVERVPVSIFILDKNSINTFSKRTAGIRPDQIYHYQQDGYDLALAVIKENIVVVVGKIPRPFMEKLLKAYGSYPNS